MESATPCFYIICCSLYTKDPLTSELRHAVKLGTTAHPESRKAAFSTTHPSRPHYKVVFQLDPSVFRSPADLYRLDSIRWIHWLAAHGLSIRYHIQNGGGNEWFWYDDELPARVTEFLKDEGIPIVQTLETDPYPLRPYDPASLKVEDETRAHIRNIHSSAESLKNEFKRIFLRPGTDFRRNQSELWDIFMERYQNDTDICGIIHWPTGVGKTYAILLSIVLAKAYFFRDTPLRGLLVTTQRSIFDTLLKDIQNLTHFGIKVIKMYGDEASSVTIPSEGSYVILAMSQGLIMDRGKGVPLLIQTLPSMNYFLYDEVHHCAASVFHKIIQEQFRAWATPIRLGTSATPLTQNKEQVENMKMIYGDPLQILHYVDYETAIRQGWVAKPRFHLYTYSAKKNSKPAIDFMGATIQEKVRQKKAEGTMNHNKLIMYIPSSKEELEQVYHEMPLDAHYRKYTANSDEMGSETLSDQTFINIPITDNTTNHILFACQRYREGADIRGLELGALSMGASIEPHILLQIAGRVMRLDYPGKMADILIFREKKEDETADRIIYDLLEAIRETLGSGTGGGTGHAKPKPTPPPPLEYLGDFVVDGAVWTTEKTTESVQRLYTKHFMEHAGDERIKYKVIREKNVELGLHSQAEYDAASERHPYYIPNPKVYFKNTWICWYHFLGIDTEAAGWPRTKEEFIQRCRNRGVNQSYSAFHGKNYRDMPSRPEELFDSWTDWNAEFGLEDELVL